MLNQEQIKGKWTEIKGGIRNLWGDLTDDDIEKAKGNIQSLSGVVQQKYGEKKEEIKAKLDRLLDSFENETDKSMKINDGESSYQRNPTSERPISRADDAEFNTKEFKDSGRNADDRIARH